MVVVKSAGKVEPVVVSSELMKKAAILWDLPTIYTRITSFQKVPFVLRWGYGNNIRFWKDIWIGEEPLCSQFNRLFRLDLDENCTINEWFISSNWIWQWRRSVTFGRTEEMLHTLSNELRHTTLSSKPDLCMWSLSDDGLFSVAVTRRHIDQCLAFTSVWK
ncbi:hypothetical protein Tco_1084619 [Tanacetum coccineum]